MDYAPIPLFDKENLFNPGDFGTMPCMSGKHVHGAKEKKALQIRLHKIIGQLKAIEQMIEEDRDCTDILTQAVSARKGLKSFAEVVIHEHLHECIAGATHPREGQKRLRDLLTVLERYVE